MTSTTTQPKFLSQGHTYRAVVGETLTLPCEVENLGEFRTSFLVHIFKVYFLIQITYDNFM